jgi:hypothetical protein
MKLWKPALCAALFVVPVVSYAQMSAQPMIRSLPALAPQPDRIQVLEQQLAKLRADHEALLAEFRNHGHLYKDNGSSLTQSGSTLIGDTERMTMWPVKRP